MKGIILAGGTGLRLHPLTTVTNKHLLPVGNYPMTFHPVARLKQAGITDILIVTGRDHMGDVMELLGKWTRLRSRLHLQGTGPGRGYRLGAGPCPVRHGGFPSLRRVVSTPLLARFGTGVQEITNESGVMASGDFGARARMTVWG